MNSEACQPTFPAQIDATSLELLCVQFLADHPQVKQCETAEGAYANCYAVSCLFAAWLRRQGCPTGVLAASGILVDLIGSTGRWRWVPPQSLVHWTTKVGDFSVCFTERQFDARAPFPNIEPVQSLASRWIQVQVWACEGCQSLWLHDDHVSLAPSDLVHRQALLAEKWRTAGPYPDPRHDYTPALRPVEEHVPTTINPQYGYPADVEEQFE